jgi:hypothetical protein
MTTSKKTWNGVTKVTMTLQNLNVSKTVDNFQKFAIEINNSLVDPLHGKVDEWPDNTKFPGSVYPKAYRLVFPPKSGSVLPPATSKKTKKTKSRAGSKNSKSDISSALPRTSDTSSTSATAEENPLFTSEEQMLDYIPKQARNHLEWVYRIDHKHCSFTDRQAFKKSQDLGKEKPVDLLDTIYSAQAEMKWEQGVQEQRKYEPVTLRFESTLYNPPASSEHSRVLGRRIPNAKSSRRARWH